MTYKIFNRFIGTLILVLLSFSCTSNLDFNQKISAIYPFFEVKNIFTKNIFSNPTDLPTSVFITHDLPTILPIQFNINTITADNKIVDNLKKVVFHFNFTNTTNQELSIDYNFINNDLISFKRGEIIVKSNIPNGVDVIFENSDLSELKSVKELQFSGFIKLTGNIVSKGNLSFGCDADATVFIK
jgi:hypothetical protein